MPFCPYCGTKVSEDTRFCPQCRARLVRESTTEEGKLYIQEFQTSMEETKAVRKTKLTKKQLATVIVLCIIAIIVIAAATASGAISGAVKVEYEITGTAPTVFVTLTNATGGTEQFSNVRVPHTYTFTRYTDWFLYISAQNLGQSGSVTVTIYVNGKAVATSTSSGAYVIANASYSRS